MRQMIVPRTAPIKNEPKVEPKKLFVIGQTLGHHVESSNIDILHAAQIGRRYDIGIVANNEQKSPLLHIRLIVSNSVEKAVWGRVLDFDGMGVPLQTLVVPDCSRPILDDVVQYELGSSLS